MRPGEPTVAGLLGAFAVQPARDRPVEQATRDRSAEVLLDCLGVALAGRGESVARAVVDPAEGGRAEATLLTGLVRVPASVAALGNGTAAHALDYDDVQQPWYGHPTAVLLPASLAVAERLRLSGRHLLTGYLVGLAVGDALGAALNTAHYDRGWHPTATLGTVAAAAACAHLAGASEEQAAAALGIAASTAGGLRENFGSDVKAVHAGLAARNGVVAALMALRGVRPSRTAFEGTFGFARVLGGTEVDGEVLRQHLDEGLAGPLARVGLKRYPACAATNPAVDAVLELRDRHGISPAEVARIECRVEPLAVSLLTFDRPETPQQARFSLQHCLAAALLDGELGLRQFQPQRVIDPAVRALGQRVQVIADPSVPPTGDFPATVAVTLTDGRTVSGRVAQASGKPGNPMGRAEVLAKFRATAGVTASAGLVAAAEQLLRIDEAPDVSDWTTSLRAAG